MRAERGAAVGRALLLAGVVAAADLAPAATGEALAQPYGQPDAPSYGQPVARPVPRSFFPPNAPPVAPPASQAVDPEARYEPDTRVLTLIPPPGVVPTVREAKNPPRLIAEWPATWGTVPRGLLYGAGLVYRFTVEVVGDRTRVTVYLRAPIDGAWTIAYAGPRTQIKLLPDEPEAEFVRPIPKRTPRPAPRPMVRITPAPVFPLAPTPRPLPGWVPPRPLPPEPTYAPGDRLRVPDPFRSPAVPLASEPPATPAPTPAPTASPSPLATPVPLPSFAPSPEPTPSPLVGPPAAERPVFGSQVFVGAEVPVGLSEVYPQGGSETTVPWAPGGGFGWDHMLSEHVGLAFSGRTIGYTILDASATARGFEVKHKRDDYELGAGVVARQAFGGGFEGMLQPGLLMRTVRASTTHAALTGGVAGPPAEVDTTDYLTANWLAYGGAIRGGLGWRPGGPFALVTFSEFRYLANGSVFTSAVPGFFPIWGWRAGAEARLDFEGWGLGLGYAQGHDEHGGATPAEKLTQDAGTPYLRAYWLY